MGRSASADIACHGVSHVGVVRTENQDAIRVCDPENHPAAVHGHLYAIADGMGGYEHGGLASAVALETFFETFYNSAPRQAPQRMRHGVNSANLRVYQLAQQLAARMGTTLTAASILGNCLSIAHVGDSRAYLVRRKQAVCLTTDHTLVGELVRMRVLPPDKVRTHSQRSVLNRCLGLNLFVQPDVIETELQRDDMIILCSDGVWSVIQDKEFGALAHKEPDPMTLSQRLLDLALERKSDDNVSAVVINVQTVAMEAVARKPQRAGWLPRFLGNWILSRVEV